MTFKPHHDPTHLYFVTATIMGWKHLFIEPAYARIVLDSLEWHRQNDRWSLYVFVVMPNHVHLVVRPLGEQTISTALQSFGSYTAHVILDQLRTDGRSDLLRFFAQRCDQDITKEHQVWLPVEAKNVYSVRFLRQKVEYIHNNPVDKHWHLVDDRADYPYSSACFYDRGESPIIEVGRYPGVDVAKPPPRRGLGAFRSACFYDREESPIIEVDDIRFGRTPSAPLVT